MRDLAAEQGRKLRFGLRIHILSRDTAAEAWAEADRIQAGFDPAVVAAVRQRKARMDSVGAEWLRAWPTCIRRESRDCKGSHRRSQFVVRYRVGP